MLFQALYLKEHVSQETDKIDTQMIIIYDPIEETFFYYATRQKTVGDDYVMYHGLYHYTRMAAFLKFLNCVFNSYMEVVSFELHTVSINENEYSTLNFYNLLNKIKNRNTEIVAYDKISDIKINDLIDMLIMHEISS
jgi:hypothetical protein